MNHYGYLHDYRDSVCSALSAKVELGTEANCVVRLILFWVCATHPNFKVILRLCYFCQLDLEREVALLYTQHLSFACSIIVPFALLTCVCEYTWLRTFLDDYCCFGPMIHDCFVNGLVSV